jgi:hypothetical protein
MLWRTNQEVLLKCYITDRKNEERKKTKEEEMKEKKTLKYMLLDTKCNERDVNGENIDK